MKRIWPHREKERKRVCAFPQTHPSLLHSARVRRVSLESLGEDWQQILLGGGGPAGSITEEAGAEMPWFAGGLMGPLRVTLAVRVAGWMALPAAVMFHCSLEKACQSRPGTFR